MGGRIIRSALAGVVFATFGIGSVALAADLPLKTEPVAAPPSDWTGFYIGINGGAGWAQSPLSESETEAPGVVLTMSGLNMNGFVVGGQFGYNWQYRSSIVVGFEFDADYADIKGSTFGAVTGAGLGGGTATFTASLGEKATTLASARGRLGWLPTNWLMVYGTGGPAWERLEQSSSFSTASALINDSSSVTAPVSEFGFVVGVGVEAKVPRSNWLARVEYLHYDFGNLGSSVSNTGGLGTSAFTTSSQTIDVVRGGLSYKF
jgi:opacity protein-like surface antigen